MLKFKTFVTIQTDEFANYCRLDNSIHISDDGNPISDFDINLSDEEIFDRFPVNARTQLEIVEYAKAH